MFVPLRRAQTWHLHTKLFKFGWHTSANNSPMKNSRDPILVYMSTTYHIFDSWVFFMKWLRFLVLIAWLAKTENSLPLKKRSSFGWSNKQECTRHGTMQQNSTSEQSWSCDALQNAKFNLAPRVWWKEESLRAWERSWRRIKQRKGRKATNNWKPLISLSN